MRRYTKQELDWRMACPLYSPMFLFWLDFTTLRYLRKAGLFLFPRGNWLPFSVMHQIGFFNSLVE